ncbi:hypothetical protein WJX77_007772 [Trebouxia sp. C0004]
MLKPMKKRWSAHARVILPLLALATLTLVTCRTTLSPPAAGGSWAKESCNSADLDGCISGSPAWSCKIKAPFQPLLDWCNVQFKLGDFHSFAHVFDQVLLSGWVKTVEAFRHAVAYLVEQKMWLAMRPPSGVDWACLSLCGLCIVCALEVHQPPAQASLTLPLPLD